MLWSRLTFGVCEACGACPESEPGLGCEVALCFTREPLLGDSEGSPFLAVGGEPCSFDDRWLPMGLHVRRATAASLGALSVACAAVAFVLESSTGTKCTLPLSGSTTLLNSPDTASPPAVFWEVAVAAFGA